MKLATLADGTREGRLVVVSRDLTRCSDVRHLAATLQAALEDWERLAPQLDLVARGVETGGQPVERFHEREAMAPLPSANFVAPRAVLRLGAADARGAPAPEIAVITGPAPLGADRAAAAAAIRLVTLTSGLRLEGGAAGCGSAMAAASMAPVAVTPAGLGPAWDGARLRGALMLAVNGRAWPVPAEATAADFADLIAQVARGAALAVGAVVRSGASAGAGAAVGPGDTLRVEVREAAGHSLFGAIEQRFEA